MSDIIAQILVFACQQDFSSVYNLRLLGGFTYPALLVAIHQIEIFQAVGDRVTLLATTSRFSEVKVMLQDVLAYASVLETDAKTTANQGRNCCEHYEYQMARGPESLALSGRYYSIPEAEIVMFWI